MSTLEVVVGRIGKPHGIRGEVTVDVRSDEPDRRYADGTVLAAQPPKGSAFAHPSLTVDRTRWHQGTLLVTFAEFADRNAAEAARGVVLVAEVDDDERPDDPDEFYDHQMIGVAAYDQEGTHVGEVTGIAHGAQDLLQIRTIDGREVLVPFVTALVPEVDLDARRLTIADRPGLIHPLPEDETDERDGADG